MADIIDNTQIASDFWTQRHIDNVNRYARRAGTMSAYYCQSCGERIPEARRQAVQGVQFCVECQTYVDDGR
jgi:phage/conjugal plasmid C-4 type zinc finger TraR family protein